MDSSTDSRSINHTPHGKTTLRATGRMLGELNYKS